MATLKDLRERALLSQVELARLLGVNSKTVWDWEHGNVKPSSANRRKLVIVLRVTPQELLQAIEESAKEDHNIRAAA
jgi:DNA-binding transcriptional regulator YiaG